MKIYQNSIQLYTALHRLNRQLHRRLHNLGHANGFYREQSRLLLLIAENDGVIQRDLAEEMDMRPSSMSEMLAKMEELGFLLRKQDDKDQRVMHIFLTERGKSAVEESQSATKNIADTLFKGLSGEEIQQMLFLTEKLCAHLETMDTAETAWETGHYRHHRGYGDRHSLEERHGHHRDYRARHGFDDHSHCRFDNF